MTMYNTTINPIQPEKTGFVYIWYDSKDKRFYIGCHWGFEDDGYICSSRWMNAAYKKRPQDFKRRIIKRNIQSRPALYEEELRYLHMIKSHEIKTRYYNLNITNNELWHKYPDNIKTIGQKISARKMGKNTGKRDASVGLAISKSKRSRAIEKRAMGLPAYTLSDKVRAARQGRTMSADARTKISDSHKRHWTTHVHHNKGRKLSKVHRDKVVCALWGRKRSAESRAKSALSNSKSYIITHANNHSEIITGLKSYGVSHNIPHITLNKASQHNTPIPKHNILSIRHHI